MGGCEEGEGKGTKLYGVVGITDGPGCVSTLILIDDVVVAGAEDRVLEEVSDDDDEGEVIPPERDELRDELEWDGGCECDGRVVMDK